METTNGHGLRHTQRIQLFTFNCEIVNLSLPIFFIMLGILEVLFSWRFTGDQQTWFVFIAKVLLFNHTHIVFSFVMILFLPEVKSWRREKGRKKSAEWVLVFLGFWLLINTVAPHVKTQRDLLLVDEILSYGLIAYGHYHIVSQTIGLSHLYNHNLITSGRVNNDEEQEITKFDFFERILLVVNSVFTLAVIAIQKTTPNNSVLLYLQIGLAISTLSLIWMFWNCFKRSWRYGSNKLIFLIRVLLIPLSAYSYLAFLGYLVVHGIEYAFVFRGVFAQSKLKNTFSILVCLEILAIFLFFVLIALFRYPPIEGIAFEFVRGFEGYFRFLVGISAAASQMHYYLDGQLFRMKDTITRERIGPLLALKEGKDCV